LTGERQFAAEMEANGFMSVQIDSRQFWFKEDVIRFKFLDDNVLADCGTMCKFVVETWMTRNGDYFGFKLKLYVNGVPLSNSLSPDVFIGSVYDFIDNMPLYWLLMFGEVGVRNYGRKFISSDD
jgi:hypothetical protein